PRTHALELSSDLPYPRRRLRTLTPLRRNRADIPRASEMAGTLAPDMATRSRSQSKSPSQSAPGVIVFTACLMLVAAGLHLTYGIGELTHSTWGLNHAHGIFAGHLWVWGIIDILVAVGLAGFAGDLLRGGETGRVIGIAWLVLSAIRFLYWIP